MLDQKGDESIAYSGTLTSQVFCSARASLNSLNIEFPLRIDCLVRPPMADSSPQSVNQVGASSNSFALPHCLTMPYMNFLFSFNNWEGMDCHNIFIRGTISAGACFEKSCSCEPFHTMIL
ncbi:MAG: hypothetical protein M0P58_04385 [Bacteroidales bacterium]|nr:hypothetical protein [Bacteroidales bacterium]